jgi:hypothetical protein
MPTNASWSGGTTNSWLWPQIDSCHIKVGQPTTAWANATIFAHNMHKLRYKGCRPWCATAPMTSFSKAVPRQCRCWPEGLRMHSHIRLHEHLLQLPWQTTLHSSVVCKFFTKFKLCSSFIVLILIFMFLMSTFGIRVDHIYILNCSVPKCSCHVK